MQGRPRGARAVVGKVLDEEAWAALCAASGLGLEGSVAMLGLGKVSLGSHSGTTIQGPAGLSAGFGACASDSTPVA